MRKNRYKAVIITAAILAAVAGVLAQQLIYRSGLRAEMDGHIADMLVSMERGNYVDALAMAQEAQGYASELRSNDELETVDSYISLIDTVIRADAYYFDKDYPSALGKYQNALLYASQAGFTDAVNTRYIEDMAESAESYIAYFDTMQRAGESADDGEYRAALSLYNEAAQTASDISFADGYDSAVSGARLMNEEITLAKRHAYMRGIAQRHIEQGNMFLTDSDYAQAVREYQNAMELYIELGENELASDAEALIDYATLLQASSEAQQAEIPDEAADGDTEAVYNPESIYEYNRSLTFDLVTLIDSQRSEPASLVRMGTVYDRNEGWYNGCGWIAAYNLLIKLNNPRHPADIVRYFEMTGGTVMDGMFGTYPSAIESYLAYLGYDVNHTLFPQTLLSIDDELKTAGVGIIAYMHTSAAHYAMIEYRESDGRFIVYNDAFARARSEALELSELSSSGAVIDSVELWLAQTSDILFAFSLITA